MKICIITEGSVEKGFGHIKRMLYLANALRSRGQDVTFLTKSNDIIRAKIREEYFWVIAVEHYASELKNIGEVHVFIIDKQAVETSLAFGIRNQTQAKLIIFGNTTEANKYAHLVVNSVIGSNSQNCIAKDEETSTLFFQGPKYALLGEDFLSRRGSHLKRNDKKKILLIFGGSDPSNLTCTVCKQLLTDKNNWQITICIGPLFLHLENLKEICENHPRGKIQIVRESTEVYNLMLENDLLITSPGNTLLEAFCIGIPVIAFYQNAFQKNAFQNFPAIYNNDEINYLNELINKTWQEFGTQNETYEKLEVGKGINEIVKYIES